MGLEKRERERIVSRILSGVIFFRLDKKIYKISNPTSEDVCLAEFLAAEASQNLNFNQLLTREQASIKLEELGIWTSEDETKLEESEKALESFKVNLFEQRLNSRAAHGLKQRISGIKKLLNKSYSKKVTFEHATLENFTESVRDQFKAAISTTDLDGNKFYSAENFFASDCRVMQTANAHITAEQGLINTLREIVRKDPWRSYWGSSPKHNIFGTNPRELNLIQRSAVLFAKMYENVYQNPDCPPDDVFEDDDMFDGWMIKERIKREKDKDKKAVDNMAANVKGGEVFLVAENRSDADKIFAVNAQSERMQLKSREAELKEKEGDYKLEKDLTDVKMNLRNQLHDKLKGQRGGK